MLQGSNSEGAAAAKPDAALRYDNRSIALHWITAALVLLLWCAGETIDWFPRGGARIAVRSLHILIGVVLAAIVAWRIGWRATRASKPPTAELGRLTMLSALVHYALYAILAATLALGIANAWVRGDSIFGLFAIPSLAPGNRALRGLIEDLHSWSANTLLILAAVHACAALWHHYVRRDNVLRRMWPGL